MRLSATTSDYVTGRLIVYEALIVYETFSYYTTGGLQLLPLTTSQVVHEAFTVYEAFSLKPLSLPQLRTPLLDFPLPLNRSLPSHWCMRPCAISV